MAKKPKSPAAAVGAGMERPTKPGRPSALLDARVIYCGDNLEQCVRRPGDIHSSPVIHFLVVNPRAVYFPLVVFQSLSRPSAQGGDGMVTEGLCLALYLC